jgi:hypothetical protein
VTDDTLSVSGGAGSVSADYEDMLTQAAALERLAHAVTDRLGPVGAVAHDGALLSTAVLSPGTAAAVAGQVTVVTAGPHGLVAAAARLEATALSLRSSVSAYRAVDSAQATLTGWGQAVATPGALVAPFLPAVRDSVFDAAARRWDQIPGEFTGRVDDFMENLYDNPWIVDGVIKDLPALLRTVSVVAGPVPTIGLSVWTGAREGSPFPPWSLEQASADTVAIGGLFGYFEDGTATAYPRVGTDGQPIGWQNVDPNKMASPASVAALFDGIAALGKKEDQGNLRIFSLPQPDGSRRWIVEIPGTQEWSPDAGGNPVDLTTNLRLMAGQNTAENEAIRSAMRQAGIRPGEEVLLAGHSQGGIAAASLAADEDTRREFHITHVVTGGSPIARFTIPDDVAVLAIEHEQDAVPRLDGEPNPDRPNWVTVQRDPTGLAEPGTIIDDTGESHGSWAYALTGRLVDQSEEASLVAIRHSLERFLGADQSTVTYRDYTLERNVP